MTQYKIRATRLTVGPVGEPFFSQKQTNVEIKDDGAGEFVEISQNHANGRIMIDPEEWLHIRDAVSELVGGIFYAEQNKKLTK
jgi:hypothetical protein